MGKRRGTNLLLTGSKLCSLIGLVWLAGLVCFFLEARQASLWLFALGILLTAGVLALLVAQLIRERKRPKDKD